MLAVMNGKLSEGINFSDNLGRGVMVVGLPYPNIHELEVKENLASYIASRLEEDPSADKQSIQSEFLDNACMRVVNQSIGKLKIIEGTLSLTPFQVEPSDTKTITLP